VFRLNDGRDVLPYLNRSGRFAGAAHADLVILDLNLPQKDGHEILSELRREAAFSGLPVVVFSSSTDPHDRLQAIARGANRYISKPATLEGFQAAAQEVVDCLLASTTSDRAKFHRETVANHNHGKAIASPRGEATSPAMRIPDHDTSARPSAPVKSGCAEQERLLADLGNAVHELLQLHDQQFQAISKNDPDCSRFDLLIHMANEKKQSAKYAYLRHVESHGCSNSHDTFDET
jgi:CheY-like chemotaxis protein